MRKYRIGQERKLVQAVCNQCGRELKVEDGYIKEGCFEADTVFGYFSKKDGNHHRFDLCETCYDKIISQFAIPVEIEEETELL